MQTIKVSEATGAALDWLVAKCEGYVRRGAVKLYAGRIVVPDSSGAGQVFAPSTNPAQAWPIIEREINNLFKNNKLDPSNPDVWTAVKHVPNAYSTTLLHRDGPTSLIAAMRCYVASKLGETVEVPDEVVA